jgi:transcriptional regulator with XRE-family HTH domain
MATSNRSNSNHRNTPSRIRQIRSKQGLTLDELGRRTNIDRTKLSRAERGYARLTADEMKRIRHALKKTTQRPQTATSR